ncbi:4Fe-4S binding protein [Calidifontibacillus erzurumensis]|uniref:4Fe-4S binding protein n=1 Tax=Calidifontibacillus erzurumensis TaxID=2741433 RepID=UPI0035B55ED7
MGTIKIRYSRRVTQLLALAIFTILPWIDGFRFEFGNGYFVILGKTFMLGQMYLLVLAFAISLLVLALFARTFGRLFCGWACGQTTWSEFGDSIVKRIEKYKRMRKPSAKKTKLLIDIILRMLIGIVFIWAFFTVICSYFVGPDEIIRWFKEGPSIWFWVLGTKFMVVAFIDLIVIRHSFCNTACPYGLLQKVVQKNKVLKVTFNPDACIDCDMCTKACLMGLKPRYLTKQDSCISCQECVVACGVRAEKFQAKGMSYGTENCLAMTFEPRDPSLKEKFDTLSYSFLGGAVVLSIVFAIGIYLDNGLNFNLKPVTANVAEASINDSTEVTAEYSRLYDFEIANRTEETKTFSLQVRSQNPSLKLAIEPSTIKMESRKEEIKEIEISLLNKEDIQPSRYIIWVDVYENEEVVESIKSVFYYQP